MSVDEFITALLRHIPDKQFKTIRYYGVYYRRKRDSSNIILLGKYNSDWINLLKIVKIEL
jgi:Putative transposase.